jgi:hypothetical protein
MVKNYKTGLILYIAYDQSSYDAVTWYIWVSLLSSYLYIALHVIFYWSLTILFFLGILYIWYGFCFVTCSILCFKSDCCLISDIFFFFSSPLIFALTIFLFLVLTDLSFFLICQIFNLFFFNFITWLFLLFY